MDTYAHGYGNTGHYARPGTHTSYCGRELMHEPNTPIAARICKACAKAEQIDRVTAGEVAADRAIEGPTLAERAHVRYCLVGAGRRVHYSNSDDTLCGREVTKYDDGSALLKKGTELCTPCGKVAEHRAYTRSLAAASPLAAAAAKLPETQPAPPAGRDEPSNWWTIMDPDTGEEIARVYGETYQDMTPHAEALPEVRAVIRRHKGFSRRRLYMSELTPAQLTEQANAQFERSTRAVDAVEHTEEAGAQVATVEEAEALFAAALITEAEADAGTWRGQWIGEQPIAPTLFDVEQQAEQGALFTDAAPAQESADPVRVRVRFAPADVERHVAAADRVTFRTEMDARKAPDRTRFRQPE
ncbi:hypothetical protein [Streptomyces sp. NPDC002104]